MGSPEIVCDSCGREVNAKLLYCPHRKMGECPFSVQDEPYRKHRRKGWILMLAGVLFFTFSLAVPALPASGAIVHIILRLSGLAACLLGSIFAVIVGFIFAFTRRICLVNREQALSWEGYTVLNTELRTRIVLETEKFCFIAAPHPKFRYPASVAAMGDAMLFRKAEQVLENSDAAAEEKGRAELMLNRKAAEVFEAALYRLMEERFVRAAPMEIYESSGRRIECTSVARKLLFFPGEQLGERKPEGFLEERIAAVISDWPKNELSAHEPLAPTFGLLLKAVAAPLGSPCHGAVILNAVFTEGMSRELFCPDGSYVQIDEMQAKELAEDRAAIEVFRQAVRYNNPELRQVVDAQMLDFLQEEQLQESAETVGRESGIKMLQVSIAVLITVSFILWRLSSPLINLARVKNLVADMEISDSAASGALKALHERRLLHHVESSPALQKRFLKELSRILEAGDRVLRGGALNALVQLKSDEARTLVEAEKRKLQQALSSGAAEARRAAAEALGIIGQAAKDASGDLLTALLDSDPFVRSQAARALGSVGADARRAVPALIRLLSNDGNEVARSAAASSLGAFGASAADAVGPLVRALADLDPNVAAAAAGSLGDIGPPARLSLPALGRFVQRHEGPARRAALDAMRRIDPKAAAQILKKAGLS